MENFDELIKKEMFENSKPENVPKKLALLFEAFTNNKDILLTVHNHFKNNIVENKVYPENIKTKTYNVLKKYWLDYWMKKDIEHNDIAIIAEYFNSYSYKDAQFLNKKIEKFLGKDSSFTIAVVPSLTLALEQYRKNKPDDLKTYIENQNEIKTSEMVRIEKTIVSNYIRGTLSILTNALLKEPNYTPSQNLYRTELMIESHEDVKNWINLYKERINKCWKEEEGKEDEMTCSKN